MMKLKNVFPLLMVALLVLSGCVFGKGKLEKMVKEANDECPQTIDAGMTITSVALDDDVVIFNCSTDGPSYQNVCDNLVEPEFKKLFQRDFAGQIDKDLFSELVSRNVGVKFVFEAADGEKKEMNISAEELSEAKKNPLNGDDRLDVLVEITKKKLPIDGENGVKVTEVSKHSRILFITSDLSNSDISKEQLKQNLAHLTAASMFTKDDLETDPLMLEAVKRGYDVEFVYKSDKFAGTEQLHFSNYSLKKVLGNY